ncbi:MAG: Phosphate ABC transporter permease [Promethearchaeota archaeon]|nr:MAG: Phosphate ABC transporter permease [Candidatus Lokiarchaeota archaeon]
MATEVKTKTDYLEEIKLETEEPTVTADKAAKGILFIIASIAIIIVFLIIIFLFTLTEDFFLQIPLIDFLFDANWYPPGNDYGAFNIIMGTILVSVGALVIAIPLGIGTAIYISEIAPKRIKSVLKGTVEILAGIPSIIYGYFGSLIISKFIEDLFGIPQGNCWLNGSFILGIMALPTIVSVCEDALSAVPESYKKASYALGATRWQTISKVMLPAAMSGITAGIILGMGRAIGETMAVVMVAGNQSVLPNPITNIFSGIQTITATLALDYSHAGPFHKNALFGLAVILFFMSLIINIISSLILSRIKKKFTGKDQESRLKEKKIIKQMNRDQGVQYIKKVLKKRKGFIFRIFILIFIIWILTQWFGILPAIIISVVIFLVFFGFKTIKPHIQQITAFTILTISTLFVLIFLGLVIFYIFQIGLPAVLSPGWFTTAPEETAYAGGVLHAIIGTFQLIGLSMIVAIPLGVFAGVYLSEYANEGKITKTIRLAIDSLNGTPSIVFGLFGYALLVRAVGNLSLLAGGITLAFMILPVIIRTTEEGLKAVPQSFREGSLALGSSKWQSVTKIALPAAMPAIITGIILGMGRVAGETAPLIFTACVFSQQFRPDLLLDPRTILRPVTALTFHLWILWLTYGKVAEFYAGGTALTLLLIVLFFYGIAFIIRRHYNKKKLW